MHDLVDVETLAIRRLAAHTVKVGHGRLESLHHAQLLEDFLQLDRIGGERELGQGKIDGLRFARFPYRFPRSCRQTRLIRLQ